MTAARPRNATLALTSAARLVTVPAVQHHGIRNAFPGAEKVTLGDDMQFLM